MMGNQVAWCNIQCVFQGYLNYLFGYVLWFGTRILLKIIGKSLNLRWLVTKYFYSHVCAACAFILIWKIYSSFSIQVIVYVTNYSSI
jgi:hypothetical protein